jgi:hypothetical protein
MPTQNRDENIANVLSVVGFQRVFHDFSSWGKSEIVVKVAATKPTIVTMFNVFSLFVECGVILF